MRVDADAELAAGVEGLAQPGAERGEGHVVLSRVSGVSGLSGTGRAGSDERGHELRTALPTAEARSSKPAARSRADRPRWIRRHQSGPS